MKSSLEKTETHKPKLFMYFLKLCIDFHDLKNNCTQFERFSLTRQSVLNYRKYTVHIPVNAQLFDGYLV